MKNAEGIPGLNSPPRAKQPIQREGQLKSGRVKSLWMSQSLDVSWIILEKTVETESIQNNTTSHFLINFICSKVSKFNIKDFFKIAQDLIGIIRTRHIVCSI